MYSYQVEQAIKAAAILHDSQLRKGSIPIPYITHVFSVMYYLTEFTHEEDILVAALLHDTLEDTHYTAAELTEDFGNVVADIVISLTEPLEYRGQPLSWGEKKAAYALQLTKASDAAILVAAADKIHNFRTIIEEYYTDHDRFRQDFGGEIKQRSDAYADIAAVISRRLPPGDLKQDFEQIYNEFTNFLQQIARQQINE